MPARTSGLMETSILRAYSRLYRNNSLIFSLIFYWLYVTGILWFRCNSVVPPFIWYESFVLYSDFHGYGLHHANDMDTTGRVKPRTGFKRETGFLWIWMALTGITIISAIDLNALALWNEYICKKLTQSVAYFFFWKEYHDPIFFISLSRQKNDVI